MNNADARRTERRNRNGRFVYEDFEHDAVNSQQSSKCVTEIKFRRGEPCPRHLFGSCGCLLPHLTRLATLQCGEARQRVFYLIFKYELRSQSSIIVKDAAQKVMPTYFRL